MLAKIILNISGHGEKNYLPCGEAGYLYTKLIEDIVNLAEK